MLKHSRYFPFLMALYPILHVSVWVVGVPRLLDLAAYTAAVIVFIGLVALSARVISGDPDKAFLVAGFTTVWMFSYTSVRSLLTGINIAGIHVWSHSVMLPLWLAVLVAGLLLAPYGILGRPGVIRYLNTLAVLLLLISTVPRILASVKPLSPPPVALIDTRSSDSGDLPDIYFLLMDAYGGQSELQRLLGFDNREFLKQLADRGFVVSTQSYSNYPETQLSLAATLNMDYLPAMQVGDHEYRLLQSRDEIAQSIVNSNVRRYLQSASYTIFELSIWPGALGGRRCQEDEKNPFLSPLSLELTNMTFLAKPLAQNLFVGLIKAKRDLCRFNAIAESETIKGPKFTYLHSTVTHDPYMFNENGSYLPYWQVVKQGTGNQALYVSQIKAVNSMIIKTIDHIFSHSSHRPVIILQGDHGPALIDTAQSGIEMRQSILNAGYFPGSAGSPGVPPTSPVNTFRLVLDRYAGFHLSLLTDRHFAETPTGALIDVTTRLHQVGGSQH
jgi:hypothetical protein